MATDSRPAATGGNRPSPRRPAPRPGRPSRSTTVAPVAEPAPPRSPRETIEIDGAALRDPQQLARLIGLIDRRIAALLDTILHHPRFQKLESLWRSVRYLVDGLPRGANVRIRILAVSWRELSRDFDRSPEFDASNLFRKVYSEAFGTAGGQPFGLLVGDYEIHPWPNPDHPYSDVTALAAISEVAAAAFSPFITGAHPSLLGLRDWSELERPVPLRPIYEQLEFTKWNAFREPEDRQFLGIALPPMLVRLPYMGHEAAVRGLCYRENVHGPDASRMLWGNAAFPFAAAVVRSFAETEWLASIRGVTKHVSERGFPEGVAETGGLVALLPTAFRDADPCRVSPVSPTIVTITDEMEHDLSELGFIPLASCHNSEYCAFYSNRSVRRVPRLDSAWATQNATVAAQLQYVLCISRFAHFLKIIARDMIGSYVDADSLERFLNGWLRSYVTQERDAPPDVRARYPLREAAVRVREVPGRPGAYTSVVHLLPHCELDELRGAVTLRFPMQADVS